MAAAARGALSSVSDEMKKVTSRSSSFHMTQVVDLDVALRASVVSRPPVTGSLAPLLTAQTKGSNVRKQSVPTMTAFR